MSSVSPYVTGDGNSTGASLITPDLVGDIALATFKAILQAMTIASAGFYLGKRGVMQKAGTKLISAVSMRVAIPCLLFSRALPAVNADLVASVWPMLFLPFINVFIGVCLGHLVVRVTRPNADFRNGTVAAVAMGNSTGLPIVLLSVIKGQISYLFKDSTGNYKCAVTDPIVYLGVYLLTYPIVQWVAGGILLMPKPKDSVHDLPPPPSLPTAAAAPNSAGRSDGAGVMLSQPSGATSSIASERFAGGHPAPERRAAAEHLDGEAEGEAEGNRFGSNQSNHERINTGGDTAESLRQRRTVSGSTPQSLMAAEHVALSQRLSLVQHQAVSSIEIATVEPAMRDCGSAGLGSPNGGGDSSGGAGPGATPGDTDAVIRSRRGGGSWQSRTKVALLRAKAFIKTRVLVPPVVGVLAGLVCSSVPPFYWLLCGGEFGQRLAEPTECPTNEAVLGFLTRGIAALGEAAVPLNLMLLGNSLTSGPDWSQLPLRCASGIVLCKMVLMPCFGLGMSIFLDFAIGDDGLGWVSLRLWAASRVGPGWA